MRGTRRQHPYYEWRDRRKSKDVQSVMVCKSDSPEVREAKYILYGKNVRYEEFEYGRPETN